MANKGSLFDQVAKAMSNANHARESLRNLDERAYRMQGNAKAWGKNADKFNANANALNSKAAWNDYVAAKLKYDAGHRVNDANVSADRDFRNDAAKFSAYNDLAENFWYGNVMGRNGSKVPLRDGETLAKMRILGIDGTDDELLDMGFDEISNYAPKMENLSDPRGYIKSIGDRDLTKNIDDFEREDFATARRLYENIGDNSPYKKWSLSDPVSDWRAMERLQTVTTPRYRK